MRLRCLEAHTMEAACHICCVTLAQVTQLSVFSSVIGDGNSYFLDLLWASNELICLSPLAPCLVHSKCYIKWELFWAEEPPIQLVSKNRSPESVLLQRFGGWLSTTHGRRPTQHQNKAVVPEKAHVRTHHCPRHLDVQSQVSQLLPSVANSLLLTSTWRHMSWNRTTGDDTTKENVGKGCHLLKNSRLFLSLRGVGFALIEGHSPLPSPHLRIWIPCTTQYFKKKKKEFIFLRPLRGTLNWQEKMVRKLSFSALPWNYIYVFFFL